MRRLAVLVTLLLLCGGVTRAAERALPEGVVRSFGEAENLYRSGSYIQALEIYQEIEEEGLRGWVLDYNTGNAAFRSHQFGRAVFYYERALRSNPRDPDLQHNYAMVRSVLGLEMTPNGSSRIRWLRWLGGLTAAYSISDAVLICAGLYWAGALLGIAALLLRRKRPLFHALFRITVLLAIPAVLALGFKAWEVEHWPNGVLVETTAVYSAPQSDVQQLTQLSEGTLVRQRRHLGEWYEIEVGEGVRGWVPQNKLRNL
ncbi:MAG: hypothetical protein KJ970_06490 [Candidatus Eisenbacteria bacterium]|uniref:Tetratricopeptide repeat protein n=1 Tax=Eiseniibacteriota bacterium TaxID=2212470 RepID=A0A948RT72_UNCEI|nr:hypothetical protein [Candidatus Eisenbacteria bacterium]MBU1948246.1 hypothetical protein [Candidatus Eisenbacteria bacterium]MBU2690560.1 hypothetical protein [Candidatus Eisenbacteria bacterium]